MIRRYDPSARRSQTYERTPYERPVRAQRDLRSTTLPSRPPTPQCNTPNPLVPPTQTRTQSQRTQDPKVIDLFDAETREQPLWKRAYATGIFDRITAGGQDISADRRAPHSRSAQVFADLRDLYALAPRTAVLLAQTVAPLSTYWGGQIGLGSEMEGSMLDGERAVEVTNWYGLSGRLFTQDDIEQLMRGGVETLLKSPAFPLGWSEASPELKASWVKRHVDWSALNRKGRELLMSRYAAKDVDDFDFIRLEDAPLHIAGSLRHESAKTLEVVSSKRTPLRTLRDLRLHMNLVKDLTPSPGYHTHVSLDGTQVPDQHRRGLAQWVGTIDMLLEFQKLMDSKESCRDTYINPRTFDERASLVAFCRGGKGGKFHGIGTRRKIYSDNGFINPDLIGFELRGTLRCGRATDTMDGHLLYLTMLVDGITGGAFLKPECQLIPLDFALHSEKTCELFQDAILGTGSVERCKALRTKLERLLGHQKLLPVIVAYVMPGWENLPCIDKSVDVAEAQALACRKAAHALSQSDAPPALKENLENVLREFLTTLFGPNRQFLNAYMRTLSIQAAESHQAQIQHRLSGQNLGNPDAWAKSCTVLNDLKPLGEVQVDALTSETLLYCARQAIYQGSEPLWQVFTSDTSGWKTPQFLQALSQVMEHVARTVQAKELSQPERMDFCRVMLVALGHMRGQGMVGGETQAKASKAVAKVLDCAMGHAKPERLSTCLTYLRDLSIGGELDTERLDDLWFSWLDVLCSRLEHTPQASERKRLLGMLRTQVDALPRHLACQEPLSRALRSLDEAVEVWAERARGLGTAGELAVGHGMLVKDFEQILNTFDAALGD